jgi:hypothetical protein
MTTTDRTAAARPYVAVVFPARKRGRYAGLHPTYLLDRRYRLIDRHGAKGVLALAPDTVDELRASAVEDWPGWQPSRRDQYPGWVDFLPGEEPHAYWLDEHGPAFNVDAARDAANRLSCAVIARGAEKVAPSPLDLSPAEAALAVILLDDVTRGAIRRIDPKAFEQSVAALRGAGVDVPEEVQS